jgi:hypothetical protein
MRIPGGNSLGPLNHLARSIAKSRTLDTTDKRHIKILIRKAKEASPPTDVAISVSAALFSYAQMLRLERHLDSVEIDAKEYQKAVWSLCKLTENYAKNIRLNNMKQKSSKNNSGRRLPPTRLTVSGHAVDETLTETEPRQSDIASVR